MGESTEHESGHGDVDKGFTGLGQSFVVFAQPPVASQPRQRALHHPAPRQHNELAFIGTFHDLQEPATKLIDPLNQLPGISAVGPAQLQPWEAPCELLQHQLGPIPVLHVGSVHDHCQQQAHGVDHNVSLPAGHFLAGVVAARPPFSVVFTLWLSMIAALGLISRPACSRT